MAATAALHSERELLHRCRQLYEDKLRTLQVPPSLALHCDCERYILSVRQEEESTLQGMLSVDSDAERASARQVEAPLMLEVTTEYGAERREVPLLFEV